MTTKRRVDNAARVDRDGFEQYGAELYLLQASLIEAHLGSVANAQKASVSVTG